MFRRFMPAAAAVAALALVLAACGSGTPALSDPKEIITKGFQATSDVDSFHVDVALDGTFNVPDTGGEFSLNGTTLTGDFDLDGKVGTMEFAMPALLNLTGSVILTPEAGFVKTSMTGETWTRMPVSSGDPVSEAMDPAKALADLQEFLDKEGVTAEKRDDVDCGDAKCYLVRLTIPAELMSDAAAEASMDPSDVFGDALVLDLQFDREKNYLIQASTSVASDTVGTFSITLTLSKFDEAVDVTPPPSDQVTDDPGALPF